MSGFWSARKAAVAAEEQAERAAAQARAEARVTAEREAAVAEKTDAELLADLGLPDPETLNAGDDFKAFLAREVPHRIRRLALRRMWRTDPVLACLDGLNDYDGDFTNAATDAPGVATAYRVGQGLARHVQAKLRNAVPGEAEAQGSDEPSAPDTAADPSPSLPDYPRPLAAAPQEPTPTDAPQTEDTADAPAEDAPAAPLRRMRFAFDGDAA